MKSWFRFFGLSFFFDKIAKEAKTRGVLNCVLSFALALIFIYCGALASNTVPFGTHYNKAAEFRTFLYDFIEDADVSVSGGIVSADSVVNTFGNEADALKYAKNGYNLIVDTRSSAAYDDFEAYCLSKDGKREISYTDYLALSDEEKGGYDFKIRYTADELVLTDEMTAEHESYLSAVDNEDIKKQYEQLAANKGNVSAKEYQGSIYALYVKSYYHDISAYERAGDVPLLRSYYYRNYLNSNETAKSLFIFSDVLFGFFETDGGLAITFYGSFDKTADGVLTAENADGFIKSAFASSVSVRANVFLMNMVRLIPLIAFIPVILALVLKVVLLLLKDDKYKKYTTCLKIEFSYLWVASLITAVVMFICGFFVSSEIVNILPLILLAGVMAVRTAVYIAGSYISLKRNAVKTEAAEPNE